MVFDDMQVNNCVVRRRKLICYPLAKALVFKKVRAALGFDRCKIIISGAAPISRQTLDFFWSLDVPIMEGYGMSESSGSQPYLPFVTTLAIMVYHQTI